jgi:hypothetical protein
VSGAWNHVGTIWNEMAGKVGRIAVPPTDVREVPPMPLHASPLLPTPQREHLEQRVRRAVMRALGLLEAEVVDDAPLIHAYGADPTELAGLLAALERSGDGPEVVAPEVLAHIARLLPAPAASARALELRQHSCLGLLTLGDVVELVTDAAARGA